MSLFKEKNKVKPTQYKNMNLTIDARHKKQLLNFENEQKQLPSLIKEYETNLKEYENIKKKKKKYFNRL